jgi:hypothetical protein
MNGAQIENIYEMALQPVMGSLWQEVRLRPKI